MRTLSDTEVHIISAALNEGQITYYVSAGASAGAVLLAEIGGASIGLPTAALQFLKPVVWIGAGLLSTEGCNRWFESRRIPAARSDDILEMEP